MAHVNRDTLDRPQAGTESPPEPDLIRAALEALPDPLFLIDGGGGLRFANGAARQAFPAVADAAAGAGLSTLLPESLAEGLHAALAEMALSGGPSHAAADTSRIMASPLMGAGSHSLITVRPRAQGDSTQVAELETELHRARDELQDFCHIASHDLQEPVRKILAFGERLHQQSREDLAPRSKDYLDRMLGAGERMQALIEGLLQFSRVVTRSKDFETVALEQAVGWATNMLAGDIRQTGARIETDPLPQVKGDATQLSEALEILLRNALTYRAPDREPNIRIRDLSGDDASSAYCTIGVEDNGIGFEQQYAVRIFEPFRRLHGRGELSGAGMGLAVCKRIVERHGGTVTATGIPNQGATFTIRLPLHHSVETR
jgi:signal transduction histidine kinase